RSRRYGYQEGPAHLLSLAVDPSGQAPSAAVRYTPAPQLLPIDRDLGSPGEFVGKEQTGTLAAGGTDRYTFSLRPSEIRSTATGTVYLGIAIQAAPGSTLQPAVPSLTGIAPTVSRVDGNRSFALF